MTVLEPRPVPCAMTVNTVINLYIFDADVHLILVP